MASKFATAAHRERIGCGAGVPGTEIDEEDGGDTVIDDADASGLPVDLEIELEAHSQLDFDISSRA